MIRIDNIDVASSRIPTYNWEDGVIRFNLPVSYTLGLYTLNAYNRQEQILMKLGFNYKVMTNNGSFYIRELSSSVDAFTAEELISPLMKK